MTWVLVAVAAYCGSIVGYWCGCPAYNWYPEWKRLRDAAAFLPLVVAMAFGLTLAAIFLLSKQLLERVAGVRN